MLIWINFSSTAEVQPEEQEILMRPGARRQQRLIMICSGVCVCWGDGGARGVMGDHVCEIWMSLSCFDHISLFFHEFLVDSFNKSAFNNQDCYEHG